MVAGQVEKMLNMERGRITNRQQLGMWVGDKNMAN